MSPTPYKPAYIMVADDLRSRIESGDLQPGDQLPTKRQMAAQYQVSQQVIDSAMIVLRAEGLIEGRQGKGVYVATRPTAPDK